MVVDAEGIAGFRHYPVGFGQTLGSFPHMFLAAELLGAQAGDHPVGPKFSEDAQHLRLLVT